MEKIDFVLTWVDGSDPDWLAQRRKYQPGRGTAFSLKYPWIIKMLLIYLRSF